MKKNSIPRIKNVYDIFVGETPSKGPQIAFGGVSFVSGPSQISNTPPPPISDERLNLKLDDGTFLFTDIGHVLSPEGKKLLSKIIDDDKSNLKKIVRKYEEDGREFYNFFYDIVYLIMALQELPDDFHYLAKIDNAELLMHNSILANLCLAYSKKGYSVIPEPKRNGSKPDLKINETFAEVKTIITPKENNQKTFENFAYNVNSKIEEASGQIGNEGMIFIAPWSGIVNSLFYTYYYTMKNDGVHNNQECLVNTELPTPESGKTVIVTATPDAFLDYYLVFENGKAHQGMNNFATTYYPIFSSPQHQMTYLRIIRSTRNGFVVGTVGATGMMFKTG